MYKNDDSGKIEFRIDVARKLEDRNQACQRKTANNQKKSPAVITAEANKSHGFRRTLAFSGRPYPPARITVSPAWTPERICASSLVCTPISTGTNSASSPFTL